MRWRTWMLGALAAMSAGCTGNAGTTTSISTIGPADGAYVAQVEKWRKARLDALRAPDGWLSYTGSGRLRPGHYRVGTAADNDIALPAGPPRLGLLSLEDDRVTFESARDVDVRLRGKPVSSVQLIPEEAGRKADRLDVGATQFYVVRTGTVYGWRFRDPGAPARRNFHGIEHFPVDPSWRVHAHWRPYAQPRPVTLLTSIGTPLAASIPGEVEFERDGRRYQLHPVTQPNDPKLFFIFSDRTSGKESYGGARYLFVEAPEKGDIVLDFNRSENPPCALTPHLVCPIAPPGNRLDLAISAGEKTYVSTW